MGARRRVNKKLDKAEVHYDKVDRQRRRGRPSWIYVIFPTSFFSLVTVGLWYVRQSTLRDQAQQEGEVVNKKSMEKLFQREDVRDSGKSSYDEASNNVIKSGKEIHDIATAYPSKPVCMFQIRNACEKYPDLPYFGWFSDNEKGGPVASSAEA
jgi:hypothetical protein